MDVTQQREFDVVVIGGGSTGENAAWYARHHGLTAAVVEGELVGGECTYWACMPSKALLRPGEVLAAERRVPAATAAISGSVDVEKALASRDAFASNWDDTPQAGWLAGIDVEIVRGPGRLAGERRVEVATPDGGRIALTARRPVVLATGSSAAIPPIDGLRDIAVWGNRGVTATMQVPRRLLVLGGGVVGSEMAQNFRWLGAEEVTVVEQAPHLLPAEEPFAGAQLAAAFTDAGIRVLTGAAAVRATRPSPGGPVTLVLDDGTELVGDELLVAAGRRANTDDIGLDTVRLSPGGFIDVDDQLRVRGVEGGWLYAAGDVNGRSLLTHQGKYQARLVGGIIAGLPGEAWADHRAVPRVSFTDLRLPRGAD